MASTIRLSEVILYVQNMDEQFRFYRDVLGLPVADDRLIENPGEEFWIEFDTGPCRLALHGGGKCRFGDDAPKFVFSTDDIEQTRSELLEKCVDISEVRSPAPGVRVVDGTDPEGNTFSFEQRHHINA